MKMDGKGSLLAKKKTTCSNICYGRLGVSYGVYEWTRMEWRHSARSAQILVVYVGPRELGS